MTTIRDVACEAGVSQATVSRVLNNPDIVAPAKRESILRVIDRLGYEPSATARSLRSGSSKMIAFLVGDISQPFHSRLAKSVQRAAEEHGYTVMLGDLDNQEDRLIDLLTAVHKRDVAGVLLATAVDLEVDRTRDAVNDLIRQRIPLVTTSQALESPEVSSVLLDYRGVGRDAANHLLEQGITSLAMVSGGRSSWYSKAIEKGVRAACRAANTPLRVANGSFQAGPAMRAVERLLEGAEPPFGLVAANVSMALGALRALSLGGLSVPDDVALIACGNLPTADYLVPSLSTVGGDLDTYGATAVDVLLKRISDHPADPTTILPHAVHVRESSQRPHSTACAVPVPDPTTRRPDQLRRP